MLKLQYPRLFLLLVLLSTTAACNRDDNGIDQVPIVPVEITISLDLPLFAPLQNPGGWIYLAGGSQGIIVYRVGPDAFSAFDRHCTFQVADLCRVDVDENTNITAVDNSCCGSVFNIFDGLPSSGEARRPLRQYQTMFNVNSNQLRIFN